MRCGWDSRGGVGRGGEKGRRVRGGGGGGGSQNKKILCI